MHYLSNVREGVSNEEVDFLAFTRQLLVSQNTLSRIEPSGRRLYASGILIGRPGAWGKQRR
jgi:hypothetical protein